MVDSIASQRENVLFRDIDRTQYEIVVKQSEHASESFEDILLRLIACEDD